MTMPNHEEEPYSNRFQRQLVEHLHRKQKITAVVACSNSTVKAYLTRQYVSRIAPEIGPYEIDRVDPLPNSERFETRVTYNADWSEVDFDEDEVVADWMQDDSDN